MMSSCAAGFKNIPEQCTPIDLQIHGVIPPWISGVLYCTGLGTTHIPTMADPSKVVEIQHWFDRLAMHHRFKIIPGGEHISYCLHNGADDKERQIAEAGHYPTFSFGQ
jgi:torulene dioxygenase